MSLTVHNPAHPGELLREWLKATQISITALAAHIGVRRAKLSLFVNGHSGINAAIDLLLNHALGTREGLWLDLQMQRDLWVAKQVKALRIERLLVATKTGKPVKALPRCLHCRMKWIHRNWRCAANHK